MQDKPPENLTHVEGRMHTDSKSLQLLLLGRSSEGAEKLSDLGLEMMICGFAIVDGSHETPPPWSRELEVKVANFAAVPLQHDDPDHNIYPWQTREGKHVPLAWGTPEFQAAGKDGSLEFIMTSSGDGKYMMMYGRVAPKSQANPNTDPH